MKKSRLYHAIVFIFKPIIKLIYRVEITGQDNIPKSGRVILCPNHTSLADPLILAISVNRQIFYMGKEELFRNKIFARLLSALGAFPVSRGKGDKAAINSAKSILRKGNVLGLFLEGTRSKTGDFLRPKTGAALIAFDTYTKIVPICICGKKEFKIKAFRRNLISIGKPLDIKDLGINEGTGKEFRDASRLIMEKIRELKTV
ncbi:MAG: 1-acyl-sn-glycerol-3-phosphate acyltransferase [Eubacteriales bacterium SKADARSKE-1]|nr:1-acyl-sn-glycerol-3-phosphate acyltransferase [Eubacteriales bacterium SKADARSKE-1]